MAEEILKRRTAARGWVTRARKALATVVARPDVDRTTLIDAMEDFDKRLATLDDVQSEYEVECEDIEAEIEKAADFREAAREVRLRATKILTGLNDAENKSVSSVPTSASGTKPEVKLPKLTLPTFSGDVLEWQSFWDQYEAVVHLSELPEITKFTYLRSLLEGEAKEAIQGLALTAQHYDAAIKVLQNRFGRKERIIFGHVHDLLSMSAAGKQSSLSALWKLQDSLLAHVRGLECLGVNGDQYGVLLTPLVLSCLPQDVRVEWARNSEGKESDLSWLLSFLDKELKLRETSQSFKSLVQDPTRHERKVKQREGKKASATSLTTTQSAGNMCEVCDKSHPTQNCFKLLKVSVADRKDKVRKKGLCYRCLGKGHLAASCVKTCAGCQGPHHEVLCLKFKDQTKKPEREESQEKSQDRLETSQKTVSTTGLCALSSMDSRSEVVLQVLKLEVRGLSGVTTANVLFDNGSDRTYVTSDLVRRIGAEFIGSERVAFCAFGSKQASNEDVRNMYSLELRGSAMGCGMVVATEVPVVCAPLYRRRVPDDVLRNSGRVGLVEDYTRDQKLSIDILMGLDQYWQFVKPDIIQLSDCGLVAQRTIFGWILSGCYGAECATKGKVSHQLFCVQNVCDTDLRQLWDIDIESERKTQSPVLERFTSSISFLDGRYEVALPWKTENKARELANNSTVAEQRLQSLERKLDRDPELRERYNDALREMEDDHIIEEVPLEEIQSRNPTFYMPHRPVVKESSVSTKVRPVFDASAKDPNGLSLNDCMETGPNLLPNLVEILLRFRRKPVALVADIQKAFLQIAVRPEDRDVHRFLWKLGDKVRIMRFIRLPFGNRCSPFILNATIKFHLSKFKHSHVIEELEENLYVDDWLTGADDENEACQMVSEANAVMGQASMNLTKWGSNKSRVLDEALFEVPNKCTHLCNLKILGLRWDPEEDCFMFEGLTLEPGLIITKRVVLSFVARLFDPMGFIAPFVIKLKCLFQDLWRMGIDWDVEVPEEIVNETESWIEDLSLLKKWHVPRPYSLGPWKQGVSFHLHSFGDASEKAYGACVYLVIRSASGSTTASLVLAKAKVAPVKRVTLPRLELLGAVMAAQLLCFVRNSLKVAKDCCRCWSDSKVALSWIQGDVSRWKPFVANRVGQIQEMTDPSQWSHCPGTENPADLLTRGLSAAKLCESELWLRGPNFLLEDDVISPSTESVDVSDVYMEHVNETLVSVTHQQSQLFEVERWGTLIKAIRVVAWVFRFVNNVRGRVQTKRTSELSFEELEKAKYSLLRHVQLHAFSQEMEDLGKGSSVSKKSSLYKLSPSLGDDCLLRVRGRLDFADLTYEAKHPIIVPKSHLAVLLARYQHCILKHAGVNVVLSSLREEYWILGARRTVKRVKRYCVPCQKVDAKAAQQVVAPLHESRVKAAQPFSVTGMDHAGPLYCADRHGQKFYVLLFTCAVTRAVHLELVDSLNLEDCVLAIRRFISRRGMPSVVWSDNAKTFVAAKQQLLKIYQHLCPKWNYIVPRSPWWGGWWERLVRSVKAALKKSVGRRCLTRKELETVLSEVEACVNSRPLTFVGDSIEDRSPLTPSHFLLGRSNVYERFQHDSCEVPEMRKDLQERKLLRDTLVDKFWSVWSEEYIRYLPSFKGPGKGSHLEKDDLVLIREDGSPRMIWPLGVIVEAYPGKDGVVRAYKVRTQKGDFVRSLQRLHHLELEADSTERESDTTMQIRPETQFDPQISSKHSESDSTVISSGEPSRMVPTEVKTSRFGRRLKPTRRLDL